MAADAFGFFSTRMRTRVRDEGQSHGKSFTCPWGLLVGARAGRGAAAGGGGLGQKS